MKKLILLITACCVFVIFAFIPPKKNIVGSWVITYKSGSKVFIDFRKDGTIKANIPSENFIVEGQYKLEKDIMYVTDTSCGKNYWGKYKATFITDDSVYSEVIEDSCTGRRLTVDKVALVRDKKK